MSGAHVLAVAGTQALASGGSMFPTPVGVMLAIFGPRLRDCRGDCLDARRHGQAEQSLRVSEDPLGEAKEVLYRPGPLDPSNPYIRAGLADCPPVRVQLTDGVPVRVLPHPRNPRASQ